MTNAATVLKKILGQLQRSRVKIEKEETAVRNALSVLTGRDSVPAKRKMSAAQRATMSRLMKARWKKFRSA